MKIGDLWQGGDKNYVFHAGFGKALYFTYPSKWWSNFIARHGLKYIRFHDLRHTTATLLLESDADMKAIQRLRHSQYSTTADLYTHVTKKLSRVTAEKFDQFNPRAKDAKNSFNNSSIRG